MAKQLFSAQIDNTGSRTNLAEGLTEIVLTVNAKSTPIAVLLFNSVSVIAQMWVETKITDEGYLVAVFNDDQQIYETERTWQGNTVIKIMFTSALVSNNAQMIVPYLRFTVGHESIFASHYYVQSHATRFKIL